MAADTVATTEVEADMAVVEAVTVEDTEADTVRKRTMAVFPLEKTMETSAFLQVVEAVATGQVTEDEGVEDTSSDTKLSSSKQTVFFLEYTSLLSAINSSTILLLYDRHRLPIGTLAHAFH